MSATYAADNPGDSWPSVSVTKDAVTIGDAFFPSRQVAKNGVEVRTFEDQTLNTLTVTFFVGEVHVSDDALPLVRVTPSDDSPITTEGGIVA